VPFSKFDPYRAVEPAPEATSESAARRILILRWATWITMVWTAIGFGFIAYWMMTGR